MKALAAALLSPKDFCEGTAFVGLAETNPTTYFRITTGGELELAYRCIATSPEGLVQQVAVSYLRHGYWFYVSGRIKPGKDPAALDRKLIEKYQIAISERERTARKRRGLANMQYIRYQNWFLLLTTEGHHPFKQEERNQLRDCRRVPIKFEGYSISYRRSGVTPKGGASPKWHARVAIDPRTYRELKELFLDRACHRSAENLAAEFGRLPYARYAPVRRQLLNLLRAVNSARARTGYEPLPYSVLKLRRAIVRPFDVVPQELAFIPEVA